MNTKLPSAMIFMVLAVGIPSVYALHPQTDQWIELLPHITAIEQANDNVFVRWDFTLQSTHTLLEYWIQVWNIDANTNDVLTTNNTYYDISTLTHANNTNIRISIYAVTDNGQFSSIPEYVTILK